MNNVVTWLYFLLLLCVQHDTCCAKEDQQISENFFGGQIEIWKLLWTHWQIIKIGKNLIFRFHLFLEGKGGRKRERTISVWLTLMRPLLGTWPAAQAGAPTGNPTGFTWVCRPAPNPLSHTSQDKIGKLLISDVYL